MAEVVLDAAIPAEAVRDEVFRRVPREQLGWLVEHAKTLDRGETAELFALLGNRFPFIRSFVPHVLATLEFASARGDNELLAAIEILRTMGDEHRRKVPVGAPIGFIQRRWLQAVSSTGGIDRRAWELSLVSEMRAALRAGELTVQGSQRYTPWDTGLYSREGWSRRRDSWFSERGLASDGAAFVADLSEEVHGQTVAVAERLPRNTAASVRGGKLALEALEGIESPAAFKQARDRLTRMLPLVPLPQLLLEVDRWVPFSKDLLHLTARGERVHAMWRLPALRCSPSWWLRRPTSASPRCPELRASLRAAGAGARLVLSGGDAAPGDTTLLAYHQSLPLTASFGPGTTSSSDGMRLGVSASVLGARLV